VITGLHAIVFSPEAEKVRAFFADVLGFPAADAGGGWLIFAMPPAELAVHPAAGDGRHELYLMCDDIEATLAELRGRGAEIAREPARPGLGAAGRHPPAGRRGTAHLPAPAPLTAPGLTGKRPGSHSAAGCFPVRAEKGAVRNWRGQR